MQKHQLFTLDSVNTCILITCEVSNSFMKLLSLKISVVTFFDKVLYSSIPSKWNEFLMKRQNYNIDVLGIHISKDRPRRYSDLLWKSELWIWPGQEFFKITVFTLWPWSYEVCCWEHSFTLIYCWFISIKVKVNY